MTLTVGELCAGYGGLGMAVEEVFGARLAWVSECEAAPSKILAHHWPDVPNHGDMTKIDWAAVEPVDIISGGTPCQDLSHAGKRAGMTEGTRSNLWVQMREAVATIRPRYVVWENVRGAYSAAADSEVERTEGLLGTGRPGPYLRALGRVLGDLSDLGYDAGWHGLTAASVGAPHGRFRVFVVARNTDSIEQGPLRGVPRGSVTEPGRVVPTSTDARRDEPERWGAVRHLGSAPAASHGDRSERQRVRDAAGDRGATAQDADVAARGEWRESAPGQTQGWWPRADARGRDRAPAADADDRDGNGWEHEPLRGSGWRTPAPRGGPSHRGDWLVQVDQVEVAMLGGDIVADRIKVGLPRAGDQLEPEIRESSADGLADLLGGTIASSGGNDGVGHASDPDGRPTDVNMPAEILWGIYEPAIRRWEAATGRPSPGPTEPGRTGAQRLSPAFVEWMMGLPAGHVTDVPGISRNDQLKALGNGVVPQQAAAALRLLLAALETEHAA